MQDKTEKLVRRFPILMLTILLMLPLVDILASYSRMDNVMVLDLAANRLPKRTYKHVKLGENTFVTGVEGTVYWKPKSFKEAFILRSIVKSRYTSTIGLLDIIYLLIINGVLYWMLFDIKKDNFLSPKVIKGVRIITYFIGAYMLMPYLKYYVSNYFLDEVTKGQFKAQFPDISFIPYIMVIALIKLLPIIIKAEKVQRDQDLTI